MRTMAKRLVCAVATGLLLNSIAVAQDAGAIVAWGYGPGNPPVPNTGFVAVAGGYSHSLGLKADSSIVAWGSDFYGQCNVPAPNTGIVAVAGGFYHSLGLKADGSIVAWGNNDYGACNVPAPNSGFVAVAGGGLHSLGLTSRYGIGDLNCDGALDFGDINPFVLALSDPTGYQAEYPNCNILNGDCDFDSDVDFDDINAFVDLLSGG